MCQATSKVPPVIVVDARRAADLGAQHHQRLVQQPLGFAMLPPVGVVHTRLAAEPDAQHHERLFQQPLGLKV